jgi:predicted transcriptional regulator
MPLDTDDLCRHTATLVAAYLGNHTVPHDEIEPLIATVYEAFQRLKNDRNAVPIEQSVTPEALICLECGTALKRLAKHLATRHGMAPIGYRRKWNLPRDYPMTAELSSQRSQGSGNPSLQRADLPS